MAEVYKMNDHEYRFFYASAIGYTGVATSTDGIHFEKRPEAFLYADRPNYLKTDWGWIMLSERNIFLSLDGLNWFQYKEHLLSDEDLKDRSCGTIWTCEAIIHENRVYYYLEITEGPPGTVLTSTNIFLITWDL